MLLSSMKARNEMRQTLPDILGQGLALLFEEGKAFDLFHLPQESSPQEVFTAAIAQPRFLHLLVVSLLNSRDKLSGEAKAALAALDAPIVISHMEQQQACQAYQNTLKVLVRQHWYGLDVLLPVEQ